MCEGSKIKHLFWEHISRFQFPLPDTPKQSRIIEKLRDVDAAVPDAEWRLEAANDLKHQLLQSAMRSEVEANA
jgi:restriction endonuclease S subunit